MCVRNLGCRMKSFISVIYNCDSLWYQCICDCDHNLRRNFTYGSLWVQISNLESQLNGKFWRFANNWCLWQSLSWIGLCKMGNNVKYLQVTWTSTCCVSGSLWTYKLNVIFIIIRYSVLVDRIKCLKTYNSFKTIF